jgi:hypothetical protein
MERDSKNEELDRELDAALAKYAAVEPRVGLEDRILANLRTEPAAVPSGMWWMWCLAGGAVALLAIALAVGFRVGQSPAGTIAHHNSTPGPAQPVTERANRGPIEGPPRAQAPAHAPKHHGLPLAAVTAGPKLDVFPSPLPLTEQEKLLAGYIAEEPEHAVLLARAQAEDLRRDEEEETRESSSSDRENSPQLSK